LTLNIKSQHITKAIFDDTTARWHLDDTINLGASPLGIALPIENLDIG
jgi:hypothetical protein